MAAEIETSIDEQSQLIQSSGGVFEVEYDGKLIFSKKALGRFPEDKEVLHIVNNLNNGMPLHEAQAEAAKAAPKHPSFGEWLQNLLNRKRPTA